MSLIGTLEQLNLSTVLQRLETYAKTGLLIIKQEVQRVELYFRDGRLMCIGPMRGSSSLGERLLQANVISPRALQEALLAIGESQGSETRVVLALMDLGHVTREELRTWAAKEAAAVIQVLLNWPSGEMYFEEGQQTPPDRLLVALSISTLLPAPIEVAALASTAPAAIPAAALPEQSEPKISAFDLVQTPILVDPAQFVAQSTPSNSIAEAAAPIRNISPPPERVDTSFMRPEMILLPTDLSALRVQNPEVQVTPEQWRLLTRVDGRTTLQMACQELAMSPEMVRRLAGELIANGLVHVTMPVEAPINELSPLSRNLITSGLSNGYVAPGYAASPAQPWVVVTPTTDPLRPMPVTVSMETQSQWGNGGNGATFVPGRGWVLASQSGQVLQPGGPIAVSGSVYAQAGGVR